MNFKEQAERFITESANRRRNPIKAATVSKYYSYMAHAIPLLGNRDLSKISNNDLKTLVASLRMSDASVVGVVTFVKQVIASAVDSEGRELHPRVWNNDFIDIPVVNPASQRAPIATPEAISEAISRANGQDKALIALLAGTGLRIGEALALTSEDWNPQTMTLFVTKTVIDRKVQNSTKTPAGRREIDLAPELNDFIGRWLAPAPHKPLFQNTKGGILREMTAYEHLHKLGIPGFHSLRRFRITHLRKNVPEGLVKFWAGHADETVTDRYDKVKVDTEARKRYAAQAGLGFQLEAQ